MNAVRNFCRQSLLTISWVFILFAYSSSATSEEFPTARWKTASPESQGLDSAVLAEALDYVRAKGMPVHSLLIVRNGVMVLDAYFYPYQGREVHDVASGAKSVTSAAVGVAIAKGYFKDIDQKVFSVLQPGSSGSDPRKESMTIRHLLTMTSGLDCDTEGGEKALAAMGGSGDWAKFALALPLRTDPGSQYAYCSCNTHLLSSLVTAATGESLLQFATKNLFHAMGITNVTWPSDPLGRTHGWGDLHTTWVVPIGLDGKRRLAPVGPHSLPVATVGRWLSDSEFWLDLNTVANVNHFVFNVRSDGERVRIRMNEITGEMKNVEVEGIAIRGSNRVTSFIEWLVRHRLENRRWIEGKWVEKAGRRRRLRRLG